MIVFVVAWFAVGCVLNLAVQELAKAGQAWKDETVTRPLSSPFALKSAVVTALSQFPSVKTAFFFERFTTHSHPFHHC
jgi:hypothetical protein